MSAVLVVTRNVGLVMGLELERLDVVRSRPNDNWLALVPTVDAVLLDLGGVAVSVEALRRVRELAGAEPIVVLGSPVEDWAGLDEPGDRTIRVVAPESATQLAATLLELITAAHASVGTAPAVEPADVTPAQLPAKPLPPLPAPPPVPPSPPAPHQSAPAPAPAAPRPAAPVPPPSSTPPSAPAPAPAAPAPLPPAPLPPAPPPSAPAPAPAAPAPLPPAPLPPAPPPRTAAPPAPRIPEPSAPATAAPPTPARLQPEPLAASRQRSPLRRKARRSAGATPAVNPAVSRALRDVLNVSTDVVALADVALAIVAEAMAMTGADAATLLVRADVDAWKVEAGIGLRPLELRAQLTGDSWLVQKVIYEQLVVVVEESDIARTRLRAVPLGTWRHVAAAPISGDRGILILASEEAPFSKAVVGRLAAIGEEAKPLLEQAMLLRRLAQSLQTFT